MLRQHQEEIDELCQRIAAGADYNTIFLDVIPGGGKSMIPMICASRLIPKFAQAVCWVVPQKALARQGAWTSENPETWAILDMPPRKFRESTNDWNPCRDGDAYITTYQALVADRDGINAKEFGTKRYILILDEPHHLAELSDYHQAVMPLVKKAALVILMSGTFVRHDNVRIAFVPYVRDGTGYRLDMPREGDDMGPYYFIKYGRQAALAEKAIKPLIAQHIDGSAEWLASDGEKKEGTLSEGGSDASEKLHTALRTDYAYQLLARSIGDWRAYRSKHPFAKLLVIAPAISEAKQYLRWVKELGVTRVQIATSDEAESAVAAIDQYKKRYTDPDALDVLVTVNMAYEGLDVPQITHLALLTHIRSVPWIMQALHRAARMVDEQTHIIAYERQAGFVYGPDDPNLTGIIKAITDEQNTDPFIAGREYNPRGDDTLSATPRDTTSEREHILPLGSATTRERTSDVMTGETLDYEDSARMLAALRSQGLGGILDPLTFKRVLDEYHAMATKQEQRAAPQPIKTIKQREMQLRRELAQAIAEHERKFGLDYGTINRQAYGKFHKAREDMSERELQEVWQWLQRMAVV